MLSIFGHNPHFLSNLPIFKLFMYRKSHCWQCTVMIMIQTSSVTIPIPNCNGTRRDSTQNKFMMLPSSFQWQFYAILVILFTQTLLQPAQGTTDAIYTEMHDKLLNFQKLAQQIVNEGKINSFIKEKYDKRVSIIKDAIEKNAGISQMYNTWKSDGIEILDDYLTLRQKEVDPSWVEKMHKKWLEIIRPLNQQDGKIYSEHQREDIQKEANKLYLWKFLDVTKTENAANRRINKER